MLLSNMRATRDTSQRRLQISELVRQHGSVQVTSLAKRFGVSMQTVRKDLRFLKPGDTIVIDSGTTGIALADALPNVEVTVVTNDFGVLSALAAKNHINIVMLGGELRRKSMSFYGGLTVEALNALHVDKLFLGVDGFDLERGVTTHFEPEAMLNRKMVENAGTVIAITDSSKFGRVCLHRIIAVAELDTLITDRDAPAEIVQAIQQLGVEVQQA